MSKQEPHLEEFRHVGTTGDVMPLPDVALTSFNFHGTEAQFHEAVRIRSRYPRALRMWGEEFRCESDGNVNVLAQCACHGDLLTAFVLSKLLVDREVTIGWIEPISTLSAFYMFTAGRVIFMYLSDARGSQQWDASSGVLSTYARIPENLIPEWHSPNTTRLVRQEEIGDIRPWGDFPSPDDPLPDRVADIEKDLPNGVGSDLRPVQLMTFDRGGRS